MTQSRFSEARSALLGAVAAYGLFALYEFSLFDALLLWIYPGDAHWLLAQLGGNIPEASWRGAWVFLAKALPAALLLGGVCAGLLARRGSVRWCLLGALALPVLLNALDWIWVIQPLEAALNSITRHVSAHFRDWAAVQLLVLALFAAALITVVTLLRSGRPRTQSLRAGSVSH